MIAPLAAVALPTWLDPDRAFQAGFAEHPYSFWLDAGPDAAIGWSWVGSGRPEADADAVRLTDLTAGAEGGVEPDAEAGPFRGGWVGWSGYDDAADRAGAPTGAPDGAAPQTVWLRAERFLAFDHARRRVWAFAADAETLATEAAGWAGAAPPPASAPRSRGMAVARHLPGAYADLIAECRDAIREGDAYQLCLTTRFSVAGDIDPAESFRALRAATASHHAGFVRSGSVALASASPERFLEVQGGVVRTHPIKGTRPRGDDVVRDALLAAELLESPKERAENVMIVDLMRNDLSRVSVAGSIAVDRLLDVESYPAVHQLVSTVSGILRPGTTLGDLLDAAFPAGSMTGAPKLSAMTILHGLEAAPRGVFAGCFGWVGDDGAADLAMIIRSIVFHPGGAYVGAGGGITWGSDAAAEVAEVGVKARGPLRAIGAELPPGW
ncbi:anthranilate synthase component I family protein [Microbacterium rhizomatis]|uniref:Anthranilate synthase component I family protein n=1 Tax=Microbacterium rhizomatis TaxID=1631477 RepID=A0A5J5J6G1_9MICO|nr:chorismate-binding protein [Microbacterium rhizomatis]KAA9110448.1 anthranilate synthase component I family protein [Microbacterium rhizomatis]